MNGNITDRHSKTPTRERARPSGTARRARAGNRESDATSDMEGCMFRRGGDHPRQKVVGTALDFNPDQPVRSLNGAAAELTVARVAGASLSERQGMSRPGA